MGKKKLDTEGKTLVTGDIIEGDEVKSVISISEMKARLQKVPETFTAESDTHPGETTE